MSILHSLLQKHNPITIQRKAAEFFYTWPGDCKWFCRTQVCSMCVFYVCMPHFSAVTISCLIALCHTVKRWAVESNRAQWDIRDTRTFPASKHLKQIIVCGFLVRGELLAELKGSNSKQVKSWNTDILDFFLKKKKRPTKGLEHKLLDKSLGKGRTTTV